MIFFLNLYALKLFQLLDLALHLDGLCRLIPEPFYELFGVIDHLLLVPVCSNLLFTALAPEYSVLCVRDLIVVDLARGLFL